MTWSRIHRRSGSALPLVAALTGLAACGRGGNPSAPASSSTPAAASSRAAVIDQAGEVGEAAIAAGELSATSLAYQKAIAAG